MSLLGMSDTEFSFLLYSAFNTRPLVYAPSGNVCAHSFVICQNRSLIFLSERPCLIPFVMYLERSRVLKLRSRATAMISAWGGKPKLFIRLWYLNFTQPTSFPSYRMINKEFGTAPEERWNDMHQLYCFLCAMRYSGSWNGLALHAMERTHLKEHQAPCAV